MISVIPVSYYLVFGAIMFSLSICGIIINRRNTLVLLMLLEVMLLAVNTNFVVFSGLLQHNVGNVFVFFILTVAAAEAAIGLAIVVVVNRARNSIDISKLNILKG